MSEVPGHTKLVCWVFLFLALAGCANRQTYEDSKYQFITPSGVHMDQPGWVMPQTLEVYQVSSRSEICRICNKAEVGGKGSHFKMLGLHKVSIQDRGCYIHNAQSSVGRVYYLAGDLQAKDHETAHHFHGPMHTNRRQ